MNKSLLSPTEIAEHSVNVGITKTSNKLINIFLLAILAGIFIAFAAAGSTIATYSLLLNPSTYGLGKLLNGIIFSSGLIIIVLTGAELFTGNCLIITSVLNREVKFSKMALNLLVVYLGNFIGAILIAYILWYPLGMWMMADGLVGAWAIKSAVSSMSWNFEGAVILGILCNLLVCLAVWMSYASKTASGKILSIVFPITLFVLMGFQHSIANMYLIPVGIFLTGIPKAITLAGLSTAQVSLLTWKGFLLNNLLPVTIGNLIGGVIFVGLIYWFVFLKNTRKE